MKKIIKLLATFFNIGYLQPIPGTFGCIAIVLLYAIFIRGNIFLHYLFLAFLFAAGFLVCGQAERLFKKKDATQIIIDDVVGMLLTLLYLPFRPLVIVAAFFLFRVFDILKPPPIKRIQDLPGSLGIMADDILAALYANLILQVVLRVFMRR